MMAARRNVGRAPARLLVEATAAGFGQRQAARLVRRREKGARGAVLAKISRACPFPINSRLGASWVRQRDESLKVAA
jgi:hypothetical protein